MKTDRLTMLEDKVSKLTKVVEDLQRRVEYVQRWISKEDSVVPLSANITGVYQRDVRTAAIHITPGQELTLAAVRKAPPRGITAREVAEITGRSMNLESARLHRLFLEGVLQRMRVGRKVYYCVRRKSGIS